MSGKYYMSDLRIEDVNRFYGQLSNAETLTKIDAICKAMKAKNRKNEKTMSST